MYVSKNAYNCNFVFNINVTTAAPAATDLISNLPVPLYDIYQAGAQGFDGSSYRFKLSTSGVLTCEASIPTGYYNINGTYPLAW